MAVAQWRVNMSELVHSASRAVDLMSPAVADHHRLVAYFSLRLADALGKSGAERQDIVNAAALHDIGAFSLKVRLDLLAFEDDSPGDHARAGALLLETFPKLTAAARIIQCHHLPWQHGAGAVSDGNAVPEGSHVVHLADRIAVLIDRQRPALSQVDGIVAQILARRGDVFVPEHVDAFAVLSHKDYIWLEATSAGLDRILRNETTDDSPGLNGHEVLEFAQLLCRVIDFKSAFTATHSSGVAASAAILGDLAGLSEDEIRLLRVAAYLHDVGKLATPSEILEKAGRLTNDERQVMREHVYRTFEMLRDIPCLEVVTEWCALHQERLDGSGYPFGRTESELPLGARILAVADVFTALAEDRPYRAGISLSETRAELTDMAVNNQLDRRLVDLIIHHLHDVDTARRHAQVAAMTDYNAFQAQLGA